MSVVVKSETKSESAPVDSLGDTSASDEMVFGALEARKESLKSELSLISKNRNQIMRRLKKKMISENLNQVECGGFMLVRSDEEEEDDDAEDPEITFDRERLNQYFSEDAVDEYCNDPTNHKKKKRKRTTFRVERYTTEIPDS